jgi:integrase
MARIKPTRPPGVAKPRDWKPGDGSVWYKEPFADFEGHWHRGYWVAAIVLDGKRRYLYCESQDAAWKKLAELKQVQVIAPSQATHASQTVDAFLLGWLTTVKRRSKTVRTYSDAIQHYLAPGFKGIPLKLLTTERVQEFFNRVKRYDGKGRLAASSYHRLRRVLRTALNYAVDRGYISRNPAAGRNAVQLPEIPFEPFDVWSRPEADRFVKAIEGDPHEAFFRVALMHGLRSGEVFGLQWADIDLKKGTMFVHQQMQDREFVPLKTNSHRKLMLEPPVLRLLRGLRLGQPGDTADRRWRDLVFRNSEGGPLNRSNVTQRVFAEAIRKAGVPRIRLHDLRHTFGTLHAANGTDLIELRYLMGHSNITTTMKYIRQSALNQRAAEANRKLWEDA